MATTMIHSKIIQDNELRYSEISIEAIKAELDDIIASRVGLWRKKGNEYIPVPPDKLEIYLGASATKPPSLSIRSDWKRYVPQHDPASRYGADSITPPTNDDFKSMNEDMRSKTIPERVQLIAFHAKALEVDLRHKAPLTSDKAAQIINASTTLFIANRTTFIELAKNKELSKYEKQQQTKNLVQETEKAVRNIIRNVQARDDVRILLDTLENTSTGITIGHINRVFANYISFIIFFNLRFNMNYASFLRISLARNLSKYQRYYQELLVLDKVSLENIFFRGLRELREDELIYAALGALLHDIGKLPDIDYHEGTKKYDKEIVEKHVGISYQTIVLTTELPHAIAQMAGDHHEYYGHPSGYGMHRHFFENYCITHQASRDIHYAMSFDPVEVIKHQVRAFFPSKILELVDVYDALIDPTRKYRSKAYTPLEALTFMRSDFVLKEHKLDPVIFDLFLEYMIWNKELEQIPPDTMAVLFIAPH